MRKHFKFALLNLLLSIAGLASPELARAQFLGNVSLTTVSQVLANGVTCSGSAQIFVVVNLGQTQHLATASSAAATFVMEIQGVDAIANVYKISNPLISVAPNKFLVQANGYMPITQVSVTCTASSTFSLTYSGSFSANSITNVGAPGSSSSSTSVGNSVQGVTASGTNAFAVFPIVGGALQPAINAKFLTQGVDNFSSTTFSSPSTQTGSLILASPPLPSTANDLALVFYSAFFGTGGSGLNAPWTCVPTTLGSCGGLQSSLAIGSLAHVSTTNTVTSTITNSTGGLNTTAQFIEFGNNATIRQAAGAAATSVSTSSNTLAGSTLVAVAQCQNPPCLVASASDGQGNVWRQVTFVNIPSGGAGTNGGQSMWVTGPTSAAAETVTFTPVAGSTVNNAVVVELTGTIPANPTTPNAAIFAANNHNSVNEIDPGGMFTQSGGYSYSQTITLSGAATSTFPLWDVTQNGVFSSCALSLRVTAASGTTPTLNTYLQDSADLVGFNDRLSMPQAAAAGNFLGATPQFTASSLAAVASSAVASTNQTLTAGSGIAGPMGPFGRIVFVVGGTTPSFTITYNVVCK